MVVEESSPNQNTDTRTAGIPHNISWEDAQIIEDAVSFECTDCNVQQTLHIRLFTEAQPKQDKELTSSGRVIYQGRAITGNVVAFIVAAAVGCIISLAIGKTGTGIAIIAAVIFLVLRKILVPAFMDSLPVWIHECTNCRNKTYIASDGSKASIGRVRGA